MDAAALAAALHAERALAAALAAGLSRWVAVLAPLPDRLRDGSVADLRGVARSARAAFGPKDSITDVLPAELTLPYRDAIDRLLKELTRSEELR